MASEKNYTHPTPRMFLSMKPVNTLQWHSQSKPVSLIPNTLHTIDNQHRSPKCYLQLSPLRYDSKPFRSGRLTTGMFSVYKQHKMVLPKMTQWVIWNMRLSSSSILLIQGALCSFERRHNQSNQIRKMFFDQLFMTQQTKWTKSLCFHDGINKLNLEDNTNSNC